MKSVPGGVTKAAGFTASGMACGIKRSGKPDLSLICSESPCVAAGVFTKNSVKAAPLLLTQKHIRNGKARAIITNSGNANCFTGNFGMIYAQKTAELFARLLGCQKNDVLVASTGIIGKPLPYDKIAKTAPKLVKGLSMRGAKMAAKGILTTDKVTKEKAVQIKLGRKTVTIGACAKGSGMIAPNMATMLAFVTTDAAISQKMLKKALSMAVASTFNCITIDGCMSTNDMVIVMANGQAKNKTISSGGTEFKKFYAALHEICLDLAKKIVRDGEGASKFIQVDVLGAKTPTEAQKAAFAIADSNLVKTAAFGNNPNWGRVAAAVGSLGLKVSEKDMKIKFSSFTKEDIRIAVELNCGKGKATVYTSDLSYEYVRINSKYN